MEKPEKKPLKHAEKSAMREPQEEFISDQSIPSRSKESEPKLKEQPPEQPPKRGGGGD